MLEVKNFLPDAAYIRHVGINSRYTDVRAYDGEVYKRVAMFPVPNLHEAIEKQMGPVLLLGQGFRLNYAGEKPNHGIHVDTGWGTHALVLYLSRHPDPTVQTGTAFFEAKEDGYEMVDFCQEEFNKAVIYRSDQPHSRWPLEAYGDEPVNGRLIIVAFFTPLSEL